MLLRKLAAKLLEIALADKEVKSHDDGVIWASGGTISVGEGKIRASQNF